MTILCLGSNAPDGAEKINAAVSILQTKGCSVIAASPIYPSSHGYLNQVVSIDPHIYDQHVLTALTKWAERRLGRLPSMKAAGQVPIDIDIVIFRGRTVRPADFSAPYFQQGYHTLPTNA